MRGARLSRFLPLLFAILANLGACRASAPPVAAPLTATSVGTAAPARAPLRARCDSARAGDFPAWDAWARDTLHEGEGLTFEPVKNLSGERLGETERLLRLGLEACDVRAPMAAAEAQARALVPALQDVVAQADLSAPAASAVAGLFRLQVVNALTALDPGADHAPALVALLAHGDPHVRLGAAFHARKHPLLSVRAPLLERVREDPNVAVRRQAAESLFALAGVSPPFVHGHAGLKEAIDADDARGRARAVRLVERLIGDRAAPAAE